MVIKVLLMLYKFGGFLVKNPLCIKLVFGVLLVFSVIPVGSYLFYPKNGYQENYDLVEVRRVIWSRSRGSEPGFEAYSLIDKKVYRYDNTIDEAFMKDLTYRKEGQREVGVYWYHKGALGKVFNERAVLGVVSGNEQINDVAKSYKEIEDRILTGLNSYIIFSIVVSSLFVAPVFFYLFIENKDK